MTSKDWSQDTNPSSLTHRTVLPLCSAALQTPVTLVCVPGFLQDSVLGGERGVRVVALHIFPFHIFIIAAKLHS